MNKLITLLIVLAAWNAQPAGAATLPVIANGVTWDYSYNPDVIENTALYDKLANSGTATSPTWTLTSYSVTGTAAVVENYLRVTTTSDQGFSYRIATGYTPDADGVVTVEMRFRVVSLASGASLAGSFALGAGNSKLLALTIGPNSIGGTTGLDLSEWTTLRLTITDAATAPTLKYYINNSSVASATLTNFTDTTASLGNTLQFGDLSRNVVQSGVIDWDYVVWTNEGAYAPVPEPSAMALVAAAGICILLVRRKRVLESK